MNPSLLLICLIGGGLVISEMDVEVCGPVPKDDVYRFITEVRLVRSRFMRRIGVRGNPASSGVCEMAASASPHTYTARHRGDISQPRIAEPAGIPGARPAGRLPFLIIYRLSLCRRPTGGSSH